MSEGLIRNAGQEGDSRALRGLPTSWRRDIRTQWPATIYFSSALAGMLSDLAERYADPASSGGSPQLYEFAITGACTRAGAGFTIQLWG